MLKQRSIWLVFVSLSEPKGEKLLMRKVKSMEIDEVHRVSKCIEEFFHKLTAVDRGHFVIKTVEMNSHQAVDLTSIFQAE
ncbi:hypothetical protein T06_16273 [Trichinella sp. T6]|nr:hypothetical protein T06_16273 [Trichinella sp. T6]